MKLIVMATTVPKHDVRQTAVDLEYPKGTGVRWYSPGIVTLPVKIGIPDSRIEAIGASRFVCPVKYRVQEKVIICGYYGFNALSIYNSDLLSR
jgi:hypothetical protein